MEDYQSIYPQQCKNPQDLTDTSRQSSQHKKYFYLSRSNPEHQPVESPKIQTFPPPRYLFILVIFAMFWVGFFVLVLNLMNIGGEKKQKLPFQSFNSGLKGQILGNSSEFYINLSQIGVKSGIKQAKAPYSQRIQVGSLYDFGLTELIDFQKLQKQLFKKIAYQLYYFQFNQQLEKKIILQKYFKDNEQIQSYLDQLEIRQISAQKSIQYNLAYELIQNQKHPKLLEAEYYLADKKYRIGKQEQQKPFCIYAAEYNILSKKNQYKQFFQLIQNLNYTNFHIVYVDDFSDDGSFQEVYEYLKNSSLRLRNRIKIVRNLQKLGILANINFWIKKYCRDDQIVAIIDADDKIIGRQALKILNSVYQAPNIWYAYSQYIRTDDGQQFFYKGASSTFLKVKTKEYRNYTKWETSLMRTLFCPTLFFGLISP